MGKNIPGANFVGGNFPGGIFLEPLIIIIISYAIAEAWTSTDL